jgi:genome maintenance exonuclease 1
MRKASNRGTKVHALCEQYVLNQSVDGMPIHMEMFRQIKSYLDANVEVVRGVEIPLYSDRLQLAGRCDLVAETKQGLSVIDFKTSSREKREEWILNYYYQATIYSMMVEELYQLDVNHCAIVIAVEDSGLQVFEFDNRQYRDQVIKFVDSFKEEGYD